MPWLRHAVAAPSAGTSFPPASPRLITAFPAAQAADAGSVLASTLVEAVVVIVICVFVIVGLTYMGAGAWLRDRERNAERRRRDGGGGDRD